MSKDYAKMAVDVSRARGILLGVEKVAQNENCRVDISNLEWVIDELLRLSKLPSEQLEEKE